MWEDLDVTLEKISEDQQKENLNRVLLDLVDILPIICS